MRRNRWSGALILLLAGAAVTLLAAKPAPASSYQLIHVFMWAHNPSGNLTFDAAGTLYGTTQSGGGTGCGGSGCGVVWKLMPNANGTWTVKILHVFRGRDGANPSAGVIFDAAGNLFGTTQAGGAHGAGTVFKLTPNSNGTWTETVIYSFTGGADGNQPYAGLIFDTLGNLYGTTLFGGTGCGVVFKVDMNGKQEVVYTLTENACWPRGGLLQDQAGNFYGTTSYGGGAGPCWSGCGTVFKLDPTGNLTVLHAFSDEPDGRYLFAGLIQDANGNLYGTSEGGGMGTCYAGIGCGTIFQVDINGTETILYRFTGGSDGAQPTAGLVRDNAGNLYGTTSEGGVNCAPFGCGTVFKLDVAGNQTVLHQFRGVGESPNGPVIIDPAGNLYGTTSAGSNNYGVVFKITP